MTLKNVITNALCSILRNDPVDWPGADEVDFYEEFLQQANQHGVDALVCHLLQPSDTWAVLPESFKEALLTRLRGKVAFEMLRAKDLSELSAALSDADIPMLVIKGAALSYSHYVQPYLRARCDTDIFIAPQYLRNVRELLRSQKYEIHGKAYKSRQFNAYRAVFGGAVNYDVHWRLNNHAIYARILSAEEVFRGSVPVPGLDGAFTLKPVHALLLACMHRAGNPDHDPDRLIWLYDIHLLISAMSESKLLEFAQRAVSENIQAICGDAIEKSCKCFETELSDSVWEILLIPPKGRPISRRIGESTLGLIVDDFMQLSGVRSRVELVCEYLFPSGDYLLSRYGKEGRGWVPLLYFRYLVVGVFERVSLR